MGQKCGLWISDFLALLPEKKSGRSFSRSDCFAKVLYGALVVSIHPIWHTDSLQLTLSVAAREHRAKGHLTLFRSSKSNRSTKNSTWRWQEDVRGRTYVISTVTKFSLYLQVLSSAVTHGYLAILFYFINISRNLDNSFSFINFLFLIHLGEYVFIYLFIFLLTIYLPFFKVFICFRYYNTHTHSSIHISFTQDSYSFSKREITHKHTSKAAT